MGFAIVIWIFTLIVPALVFIGIISLIVRAFSNRNGSEKYTKEDGEDMLKSIYTYLVLFATLMMSIGGSVGLFMGVADYIVPDPYVESYESYRSSQVNNIERYNPETQEYESMAPDESEIRENYDLMKKDEEQSVRTSALKQMIQSVGWIVIPLPIFLYYQKQNKEKDGHRGK